MKRARSSPPVSFECMVLEKLLFLQQQVEAHELFRKDALAKERTNLDDYCFQLTARESQTFELILQLQPNLKTFDKMMAYCKDNQIYPVETFASRESFLNTVTLSGLGRMAFVLLVELLQEYVDYLLNRNKEIQLNNKKIDSEYVLLKVDRNKHVKHIEDLQEKVVRLEKLTAQLQTQNQQLLDYKDHAVAREEKRKKQIEGYRDLVKYYEAQCKETRPLLRQLTKQAKTEEDKIMVEKLYQLGQIQKVPSELRLDDD